ncbi:MAG TPA: porin, partial [Turneriella sp.]|nr:porin [Turneriella sp.]
MITTRTLYHSIALAFFVLLVSEARSSERNAGTPTTEAIEKNKEETKESNSLKPDFVSYTDDGITFSAGDYSLSMLHRLQFRYAGPFDADPRSVADLKQNTQSFMVRRARLKLAGHAYKPWIKFYIQYDWSQPVLRDFHITLDRFAWLTLRIGRGKVIYNDERVSSSGYQQFVNRSILNDLFTVDRQQGIQLLGRFFENTAADFNYVLGIFTGRDVGERLNDDEIL